MKCKFRYNNERLLVIVLNRSEYIVVFVDDNSAVLLASDVTRPVKEFCLVSSMNCLNLVVIQQIWYHAHLECV